MKVSNKTRIEDHEQEVYPKIYTRYTYSDWECNYAATERR